MSFLSALADLAALAGLDPVSAVALPTVVTVAARKSGMSESALVAECRVNAPLRDYLAGVCRSTDVLGALA